MHIWVDADACPNPVKEILFKAAARSGTKVTLVANHPLKVPPGDLISMRQVPGGFDVADDEIVARIADGDLVITADIPLAAEVIAAGAYVLTPRGESLTKNNIGARLNMRDFLEEMRGTGEIISGPSPFSNTDRQTFANSLDRLLTRAAKSANSA